MKNVPKIWCNSAFRPESNQQWSGPWPRPSPARLPSRTRTTSMVGTAPPRPTRPRGPRGATQPMGWLGTPLSRGARPGWPSPWRSPRSPPGSRYIYIVPKRCRATWNLELLTIQLVQAGHDDLTEVAVMAVNTGTFPSPLSSTRKMKMLTKIWIQWSVPLFLCPRPPPFLCSDGFVFPKRARLPQTRLTK